MSTVVSVADDMRLVRSYRCVREACAREFIESDHSLFVFLLRLSDAILPPQRAGLSDGSWQGLAVDVSDLTHVNVSNAQSIVYCVL